MAESQKTNANTVIPATPSAEEVLSFLALNGSIDLNGVQEQMKRSREEKILKKHKYAITGRSDGRWQTYVPDKTCRNNRRLIVKSSREKVEEAICAFYENTPTPNDPAPVHQTTMRDIYQDWIDYKSEHEKESTIIRVKKDWHKYYENAKITDKPLTTITKLDLDLWVHKMIKEHRMTKHKFGNFSLILRQILNYAVDRELIDSNPYLKVKVDKKRVLVPERKKADHTQVFTKAEQDQLIQHAWNAFNRKENYVQKYVPLALIFLFYTGLRVGEVAAIKFEDIEGRILHIRRMVSYPTGEVVDDTKGTFGEREVPLIPDALSIIDTVRKHRESIGISVDGYVFCPNDNPINTYTCIQKTFTKYCEELGIEKRSAHKARKTVVSALLDSGVNLNTVRLIAGHQDEKTTLNNYCYDRSDDEEKYQLITGALS